MGNALPLVWVVAGLVMLVELASWPARDGRVGIGDAMYAMLRKRNRQAGLSGRLTPHDSGAEAAREAVEVLPHHTPAGTCAESHSEACDTINEGMVSFRRSSGVNRTGARL